MLSNFQNKSVGRSFNLKGIHDWWKISFELDVDDGAEDLGDRSFSAHDIGRSWVGRLLGGGAGGAQGVEVLRRNHAADDDLCGRRAFVAERAFQFRHQRQVARRQR